MNKKILWIKSLFLIFILQLLLIGCNYAVDSKVVLENTMVSQQTPAETLEYFVKAVKSERKDLVINLSSFPPSDFLTDCRGETDSFMRENANKENTAQISVSENDRRRFGKRSTLDTTDSILETNLFKSPNIYIGVSNFAELIWLRKDSFEKFRIVEKKIYKDEAQFRVEQVGQDGKNAPQMLEMIVFFKGYGDKWKIIDYIAYTDQVTFDIPWGTKKRECRQTNN